MLETTQFERIWKNHLTFNSWKRKGRPQPLGPTRPGCIRPLRIIVANFIAFKQKSNILRCGKCDLSAQNKFFPGLHTTKATRLEVEKIEKFITPLH